MKVEKGSGGLGGGGSISKSGSGGMGSPSQSFVKPKTLVCYIW